jgi:hypothetical protein
MKKALNALYLAKSELKIAAEDKGGHRVKAMDYIGKAIAEVKKGIKAGSK